MSFIDKKEDVIDITLTRFGKYLLAKGKFKPKYYQFFDDDILYNSSCGGFDEHQNDTEKRILEDTPKLRSTPNAAPLSVTPLDTPYLHGRERAGERRNFESTMQDKILLYPLGSYAQNSQNAPAFNVTNYDHLFEKDSEGNVEYDFLHLTSSGIIKNIPQINLNPEYILKNKVDDTIESNEGVQSSYDLNTGEVTFSDNSKILISPSDTILGVIEKNNLYEEHNFVVEIYEMIENEEGGNSTKDDSLRRIHDIRQINELFHIKTDKDIEDVEIRTGRQNNYYRGDD